MKARLSKGKHVAAAGFKITTGMMEEYRAIREEIGLDTDISHPAQLPRLWKFLSGQVSEQYLDLQMHWKKCLTQR